MEPIYGAAREICLAINEASRDLQATLNGINDTLDKLTVVLYATHLGERSGAPARLTQAQEDMNTFLNTFLAEIRPDLAQETE